MKFDKFTDVCMTGGTRHTPPPPPKPKQLLRAMTTVVNNAGNQSEYEKIAYNRRQARQNGFCFNSHWLRKRREFCQPITERSKAKSNQTRITFDTQLKTAVINIVIPGEVETPLIDYFLLTEHENGPKFLYGNQSM